MHYRLMGINRKCKWSYQGNEGVNQRLYVSDIEEMKVEDGSGYRVDIIKAPSSIDTRNLKPGMILDLSFNKYGNLESVYIVEDKTK